MIHNGENSGVEFKRDTQDHRDLAQVLVAFANLQGGRVLLGVEKDGTVCGLTRSDPRTGANDTVRTYNRLEEWVMQACRDKIRPELIPYFEVLRGVEPGLDVAVVEVERGWGVHHVWHDQHRTYYIRVGSLSREASPEELERLFQQLGAFRVEIRPVSGSSLEDLDQRRLRDYFERLRSQRVPPSQPSAEWRERVEAEAKQEDESQWRKFVELRERQWIEEQRVAWEALLVNTEFLDSAERHPATVAGLLLFGKNPKRFLPQSGIDAAAYDGREKDYAARERSSLRGAMVALRAADGSLVESGLVEQAVEFVRRNTVVTAQLADGARREERWEYPEEAVREAVVNALVHRDYLLSATDIELSVYSDRLEIISPGRLPNGITPERMRVGCRAARNQLLKDVMRDYGYLEHMGMGVPRKILKTMREQNHTEPDLVEDGERFIVRLWKEPKPA
ncbi:MAG: ATP-binding protein [Candidatus Omnitrophota bacterium]|nr:ATP-binding protein [Candidatus Omnitrophota bacterium]